MSRCCFLIVLSLRLSLPPSPTSSFSTLPDPSFSLATSRVVQAFRGISPRIQSFYATAAVTGGEGARGVRYRGGCRSGGRRRRTPLSREGCEGQQPGVALDAFSQRCRWTSADREDGTDGRARVYSVVRLPTDGIIRGKIMLDFAFKDI